jgi:hypothetical protein
LCVKKLEGVEVENVDGTVSVRDITDANEIVDFLCHVSTISEGKELDAWLMGLGELTPSETKNSNGGPDAKVLSLSLPNSTTVNSVP